MSTKKQRIVSVRNGHGIKIRKMCASCQHKDVENDGTRVCLLMQLKVQQTFKCQKWQQAEGLAHAGSHRGKVKRREYLTFVFEVRMQEQEAIDNGVMIPEDAATLDSLRKRYEEETGLSPYVNI